MNLRHPSPGSRPHIGVSSWSLHRTLGAPHFDGLEPSAIQAPSDGALDLLDLPRELRRHDYSRLELCHFHLPSADAKYLQALREAMAAEEIVLWALLIDDGDIAHPTEGERWIRWNKRWIDVAASLGARHARVIAGQQEPTPETLRRSKAALRTLAEHAESRGVRILIENWHALLPGADEVLWLLDELGGAVGLKLDFGNWKAPGKHAQLERIAEWAESAHAKCVFPRPQTPDEADFTRCLGMMRDADFVGQYTLIYDSAHGDEWAHLGIEREIVRRYL